VGVIMVRMIRMIVITVAQRWKRRPDFDDSGFRFDDGFELGQIPFKSHSGDEIELGALGARKIFRRRLEMMGVTGWSDQIDDIDMAATHLLRDIGQQGMQHGNFQLGGGNGSHREAKDKKQSDHAATSTLNRGFASQLR
jgi:hypothetical protein